MKFGKLADYI